MSKADETRDKTFGAAVTGVALSTVVLTLAALTFGFRAALGVALGGAIATVNLVVLGRIVRAFLDQKGRTAPWAVIAVIKLLGLVGCAWLVIRTEIVPALALVVGYGALPIGVTLGALLGPKPPETPDAPDSSAGDDPNPKPDDTDP